MSVPAQRISDADGENCRMRELAEIVGEYVAAADELAQRPLPEQREDDEQHEPSGGTPSGIDDSIGDAGKPTQRAEHAGHRSTDTA